MTLWETQMMEEAAAARQLEDLNEEPEEEEEEQAVDYSRVYDYLNMAMDDFYEGYDRLTYAADIAKDQPWEDKIMSVANDMDELKRAIESMMKLLKKEMGIA